MSAARDALTDLGWVRRDHDSTSFDRGLFTVLEALVDDGERLQDEIKLLRATLPMYVEGWPSPERAHEVLGELLEDRRREGEDE